MKDRDYDARLDQLAAASSLFDPVIENQARTLVEAVQWHGDSALTECAARFDGVTLQPRQFAVTRAEMMTASLKVDPEWRQAMTTAHRNIAVFSRRSLRRGWTARNRQGAIVGEKYDPFTRVGIYIPGGSAPLVSTALMTITLAQVAGCPEIVVCTPCGSDGAVNPALLCAIREAGATEVFRIGGAHAVAAMALGTATIRPVQKIFGPGNAYVVAAKRLLFGRVAIDLLPGPSEVLVLADDSANPAYAAADLLAQAEHGSGHERVWLVTPSLKLLRSVAAEIKRQVPRLARRVFIERVLSHNGWLIQVRSLEDGIELANRLAPEHCEVMTRQPRRVANRIVRAGALFLGPYSPTVLGDYVAGPSHTLPTGGAGASFAGLTVDQFQRRTSVVEYDRAALRKSVEVVRRFASMEGLDAHGQSALIRVARGAGQKRSRRR